MSEAPIIIVLPWPPKELWPNRRAHFMRKATAAKGYKNDCIVLMRAQTKPSQFRTAKDALALNIRFQAPDAIRRDMDNLLAAFKYGIDAIAHVTGIDDSKFSYTLNPIEAGQKPGAVVVEIEWANSQRRSG